MKRGCFVVRVCMMMKLNDGVRFVQLALEKHLLS